MPSLLALCRVDKLLPDPGSVGVTAIDKRPVLEPLPVKPYGVYGDVQADRKNHGGLFQAVYAYAQEDADWWAAELGREIPPGLFGENLRTEGLEVSSAEIGERWRIGADLVLEVTSPRTPCATFQRRMGEPQWVKRFAQAGRVGAYLRVVQKGAIAAGDQIEVVHRPGHGVTVSGFFAAEGRGEASDLARVLAAHLDALHPDIAELADLAAR
ncbi:MOSC domain-containing protein [Gryllotalpicola ginsengisoli]|uniref:MOSC domain-containing protein n=1 Tax=Gryllotalpicola ginsengisoli TaxID=444608 RepID=UPI0003B4EB90|nr:MOSC domain-containing protein [Gryllotalpicola ginsengisoli]